MKNGRHFVNFKPEDFENAGFRFHVNGKHYKNGAFKNAYATYKLDIPMPKFTQT